MLHQIRRYFLISVVFYDKTQEYLTYGMQNATIGRFRNWRNHPTFALDKSRAKMLTLGSQQASLHCPRLTASLSPKFKPTI